MHIKNYIFIICVSALGIYLFREPSYNASLFNNSQLSTHFPKYIAHRALLKKNGDIANTLESIQKCINSPIEGIEIDIRFSKDNVPFLFHGLLLEEEISNGTGIPEEYTWDQLKTFIYNDTKNSNIISLEKALQIIGTKKIIFLDIKDVNLWNKLFAQSITKLIDHYDLAKTAVVETFNPFFLYLMKTIAPHIMTGYDFTTNKNALTHDVQVQFDTIPWILTLPFVQKIIRRIVRPDILVPRWNIKESILQSLIKHGYPVTAWTVDDSKKAQHLLNLGVKGIITNEPLKLMQNT